MRPITKIFRFSVFGVSVPGRRPAGQGDPRHAVNRKAGNRQTLPVSLFILLATATPSAAQTSPRVPPDTVAGVPVQGIAAILYGETVLGTERQNDAAATARLNRAAQVAANGYRTLASDSGLTREALARAILSFYAHPPVAATPAETSARVDEQLLRLMLLQVAQNARLVEQNDRLIQLLDAAAKR